MSSTTGNRKGYLVKTNIFREYDIRGIVGTELIIDHVSDLIKAIATQLHHKHPSSQTIIVGRDGRLHSPAMHQHTLKALTELGFDVIDVGIVPTPAVYFAVHHLNIPTALVITASHNPGEYNGIKMWGVYGAQIQEIKKTYQEKNFMEPINTIKGSIKTHDIINDYINYLTAHFAHLNGLKTHVVIDCGNGTGGTVMPELVKKLNLVNTKLLYPEVDGTFPNHEADPTVPENMVACAQALAQDPASEIGLGLDGDCDRMNPMTKSGYLVPGDKMLALFAAPILAQHPGASVVCDIKSSGSLIDALKTLGANACIAPSGHSLIKKAMAEHKALLAGELSCHFFFHDRYFGYDDGIYAALRTLELLHTTGKTLDELLATIPARISSPEIRLACTSDDQKVIIVAAVKQCFASRTDLEMITIDGIRAHMSYGWGLVRASNTQPVICLRFESDTAEGLKRVKNDFLHTLTPYFDEQLLREKIEL